jgi:predicted SpoU family rRNA methylase
MTLPSSCISTHGLLTAKPLAASQLGLPKLDDLLTWLDKREVVRNLGGSWFTSLTRTISGTLFSAAEQRINRR